VNRPSTERIISKGPGDTHRAARDLVRSLKPGAVLALHGELGAGKTCFVQGLARALDIRRPVTSPTFTLINEYSGRQRLYHIDLYRVNSPEEALRLGLDEYVHGDGITAIEWAERVASLLPDHTIHVRLQPGERPEERLIEISRGRPAAQGARQA
jgi:tRNA threonylcarbamoyladenosine biosynthesis protein TsaE